jgi:DNA repair protein RecO (recombination protein O)
MGSTVQVYRDDGVVLRTQKLGEADRIITLLCRQNGRIRAVAKGVRRTKSRFGARLEPFTHVDLMIHPGRSLDVISQAEAIRAYGPPLAADYPRYTAGAAMLETAERLTPVEKEPAIRQFLLLIGGLRALGEAVDSQRDAASVTDDPDVEGPGQADYAERDPRLVLDAYFLRSLAVAGYAPALAECARCGSPGGAGSGGRGGAVADGLSGATDEGGSGARAVLAQGDAPWNPQAAHSAPEAERALVYRRAGSGGRGGAVADGLSGATDEGGSGAREEAAHSAPEAERALVYRRAGSTAFAVAAGGIVCESCRPPGAASPSPQTIELMQALLRGDWASAMRSERRHRVECSGLVAAYLQWHLEHSIRSLRHVERA